MKKVLIVDDTIILNKTLRKSYEEKLWPTCREMVAGVISFLCKV